MPLKLTKFSEGPHMGEFAERKTRLTLFTTNINVLKIRFSGFQMWSVKTQKLHRAKCKVRDAATSHHIASLLNEANEKIST